MHATLQKLWQETRDSDPVRQRLYQVLRQSIIQMVLAPGRALSEKEIADTFSVSRQPVREAFIRLSEAGLVEVKPQRGTYVVKISQQAVLEARFVREAIEVAIVKLAAKKGIEPSVLKELHDLLERQRRCLEPHDYDRFYHLDEAFHRTLSLGVRQQAAWKVIEEVRAQLDRVRYLSVPHSTPLERLVDQHNHIIAAIEARDVKRAEEAMMLHLREVLVSMPDLIRRFPDMFDVQDNPVMQEAIQ
ncbi:MULTISPECIES: GntR family transcriptional regulator [unclassified Halomonas]|uniref:GntR family transcriptional regulator n=1 Tax=unclassified Halomonas TaxID=2609666 RepID=UPI001EF699E3|nr:MULTISPECIES: GntR family transcriptional regulator [unclassified Halomonas]MCG7577738.1 GntR family transcriptional regulator [Halomonas sp. MMH1-48]MCG7604730.1 GntR family transcriptional regulator [Halomonas sp. MM17-34]MCG7613947.1 GntR family transcriptional regulator [Halomonas sp. MM17-29]MCG7620849.1 GntR family transcriptional regulator [Halomonas sp. DSH1-27]